MNDNPINETLKHKVRVAELLGSVISELYHRSINHDNSKFYDDEFNLFAQETPNLRNLTYNSPEYKTSLQRLQPALELHYQRNDHHPQHFTKNGIYDMNLLQLIELLADWKAATERHHDGSLAKSILSNAERFKYNKQMTILLTKTASDLKWISDNEMKQIEEKINQPTKEELEVSINKHVQQSKETVKNIKPENRTILSRYEPLFTKSHLKNVTKEAYHKIQGIKSQLSDNQLLAALEKIYEWCYTQPNVKTAYFAYKEKRLNHAVVIIITESEQFDFDMAASIAELQIQSIPSQIDITQLPYLDEQKYSNHVKLYVRSDNI